MNAIYSWLAVAGVVVVLELFTGTFYLLMFALGLASGALAAWLGLSLDMQMMVAGVIGASATLALHRSRFGARNKVSASRDPNVNLDIGQIIQINSWKAQSEGLYHARSMYRGAQWDVEIHSHAAVHPGRYRIVEIRGSLLVVEAVAAEV